MVFKVQDHFFKKAKKEKYLARSIFKLEEIDKRYKIFKRDQKILDCGYYPGSWIQYVLKKVEKTGIIVGLDLFEINRNLNIHDNVHLFCESIENVHNLEIVKEVAPFDVILSDMAPKTCGIKIVDQQNSLHLTSLFIENALPLLKRDGCMIFKIFDGPETKILLNDLKNKFKSTHSIRPEAARKQSKEFYFLGINYLLS